MKPVEAPYYESRYIRANHPDRPQALWLRETLLLPTAGDPVADVWVMVFDPDGAGNRALKEPYPIDAADYEYDNWTARIGATSIDDRSAQRRGDRRKPIGAMGSADHAGPRRDGQTPHRPRVQGADPDGQDDGAPSAGRVRRAARARRRPARGRRLDRQRQPQLGHAAHPGLRVRPGVRVRRRARLDAGDRDGTRSDRTGRCPRRRCSCSVTGGGVRGPLDPRQPADPRQIPAVLMGVRRTGRGSDDRGRDRRRAGRRHRPDLHRHRRRLEVLLQLGDRDLPNAGGGQGFRAQGAGGDSARDVRDPHRYPARRGAAAGFRHPSSSRAARSSTP